MSDFGDIICLQPPWRNLHQGVGTTRDGIRLPKAQGWQFKGHHKPSSTAVGPLDHKHASHTHEISKTYAIAHTNHVEHAYHIDNESIHHHDVRHCQTTAVHQYSCITH